MTCIIGYGDGRNAYIGADSFLGHSGFSGTLGPQEKIIKHKNLLIGFSGSMRFGQVVREYLPSLKKHKSHLSDQRYLTKHLIEPLRRLLKDKDGSGSEAKIGGEYGSAIVAYRGSVYNIDIDYQLSKLATPYNIIGSGYQYAFGAMAALESLPPKKRIFKSLEISAKFSPFVQGPFYVEKL